MDGTLASFYAYLGTEFKAMNLDANQYSEGEKEEIELLNKQKLPLDKVVPLLSYSLAETTQILKRKMSEPATLKMKSHDFYKHVIKPFTTVMQAAKSVITLNTDFDQRLRLQISNLVWTLITLLDEKTLKKWLSWLKDWLYLVQEGFDCEFLFEKISVDRLAFVLKICLYAFDHSLDDVIRMTVRQVYWGNLFRESSWEDFAEGEEVLGSLEQYITLLNEFSTQMNQRGVPDCDEEAELWENLSGGSD